MPNSIMVEHCNVGNYYDLMKNLHLIYNCYSCCFTEFGCITTDELHVGAS